MVWSHSISLLVHVPRMWFMISKASSCLVLSHCALFLMNILFNNKGVQSGRSDSCLVLLVPGVVLLTTCRWRGEKGV